MGFITLIEKASEVGQGKYKQQLWTFQIQGKKCCHEFLVQVNSFTNLMGKNLNKLIELVLFRPAPTFACLSEKIK